MAETAFAPADVRRGMVAKIHVAKKQLALAEDSYRALLSRVTGVDSLRAMSERQLEAVLAEFRRIGFAGVRAKPGPAVVKYNAERHKRLVRGLWVDLQPYLADGSEHALRAFVERQTGRSALEFCGPEETNKVVEGLKAWLARARAKRAVEAGAG